MGNKEPEKRPGIGIVIKKVLGRTSPEENGMLWLNGPLLELQILKFNTAIIGVFEGTHTGQALRRLSLSDLDRKHYEPIVETYIQHYGLTVEEFLEDEPRFAIAKARLHYNLVMSIRDSRSSPENLQRTVAAIKTDAKRRAQEQSNPSLRDALVWFHDTGADEAVKAAQEQKS